MIHHSRFIEFKQVVTALSVSADGSLIAVATGKAIDLINVETGDRVLRVATKEAATGLSISSDRGLLAVATGEPTVLVYDCVSGKITRELRRDTVLSFLRKQSQLQVAFFPGARMLATRGGGGDVTIWNCDSGQWEHLVRFPQRNGSIVMHPDGTHLALLGEPNPSQYRGQVVVFRVHKGLQSDWNAAHANERCASTGAFSPSGTHLATYAPDDAVRVWGIEAGELLAQIQHEQLKAVSSIAFAADEHHLLLLKKRTIELWQIDTAKVIAMATSRQPDDFHGFASSRDGTVLVTFGANKAIDVWKVALIPRKNNKQ